MTTPTPTDLPEPLRLADALQTNFFDGKQGREVWDAAAAELRRLHALSVEHIMLDITPGLDGMGLEVYAKSVKDVEDKLSDMGARLEDYELGIRKLATTTAPQAGAPARHWIMTAFAELDGVETEDENNCLKAARGALDEALLALGSGDGFAHPQAGAESYPPSDAMVDAYLQAQRQAVEEADRFGRRNIGGLHTGTVREACRAGLAAALRARGAVPQEQQPSRVLYADEPFSDQSFTPLATASLRAGAQAAPSSPWLRALEIRMAQGWRLKGDRLPVLYTDTINGDAVGRDDLWLCTTAALAPAAVSAPSGFVLIDPEDFRDIIRDIGQHIDQGVASERKVAAERPGYGTGLCVHIANQMAKMSRLLAAAPKAPAEGSAA